MNNQLTKILNFSRLGGAGKVINEEGNRIEIYWTLGSSYNHKGITYGQVRNLVLSADSIFESSCYEPSCFEIDGLWTTAMTSSISEVRDGVTYYFIPGSKDAQGFLWFVDLGTMCPITGEIIFNQLNIEIEPSLTFSSRLPLEEGVKVARLKRLNSTSVEVVQHLFGPFLSSDYLLRTSLGFNLLYKYEDQKTSLEDISISIINLLLSELVPEANTNRLVFVDSKLEPAIKSLIDSNLNRLSSLLDLTSQTARYGSIPRYPATYSQYGEIYDEFAESQYINPTLRIYEEGCFEEGCFSVADNALLISREVSTRAIAWFIQTLILYKVSFNVDTYDSTLNFLLNYLINQVNKEFNLPSEGWTDAQNLANSTEIKQYKLSTAAVTSIALLKAFDVFNNYTYLEVGTSVAQSIFVKLASSRLNEFYYSLDNPVKSTEATLYGLMLCLFLNKSDWVEALLSSLNVNYALGDPTFVYKLINGNYVPDGIGGYEYQEYRPLDPANLLASPNNLSILIPEAADSSRSLEEVAKDSLLLIRLIRSCQKEKYTIPNITSFNKAVSVLETGLKKIDIVSTLLVESVFFAKENLFSYDLFRMMPIKEYETLLFYWGFLVEKAKSYIPTNFSWFSRESLTDRGYVGALVTSISKVFGSWYVKFLRIKDSSFISKSSYTSLNQWGNDLGIVRFVKETNQSYRSRIQDYLSGISRPTLTFITNALKATDVSSSIKELNDQTLAFNTYKKVPFNHVIGESYFAGKDYSANVIEVEVYRPLDSNIQDTVDKHKAAGIKPLYRQTIAFTTPLNNSPSSCFNFKRINPT